jgi:SET domain-containing protein
MRSSKIHAAGCYTTTPISKGTHIVEYTGERISQKEGDRRYLNRDETYLYGLFDGSCLIDGDGIAAFINHSCEPNCEIDEIKGRVWIIALRNINPGEELTYDYHLYDGDDEAPCTCGSSKCRGSLYSEEELEKQRKAAAREARKKLHAQKKRRKKNKKQSSFKTLPEPLSSSMSAFTD